MMAAGAMLALGGLGCGGAVTSGVAVGRAGHHLSAHAQSAPQGAEVCAMQEALNAPAQGGAEKPVSGTCGKAMKSDQLWRRAMNVLAAYGESLESMSAGSKGAGPLEAAQTGVRDASWPEVDDSGEKAARDAMAQLVNQMNAGASKGDPAKAVQESAPQVKTLCDGLSTYLEAQAKALADLETNMEKKRVSRTERRCGALESKTICTSETSIDRLVYANAFGHVALLESNHVEAYNAVAGFCAAHKKLEEAAAGGKLSKDSTQGEIVEAVRSARRLQSAPPPTVSEAPPPAPPKK